MNQRESEYAVLNFDDETVKSFYPEIKAKVKWVSLFGEVDGAYYYEGGLFYGKERIMSAEDLPIAGEHNVYNALFAIAAAKLTGIENVKIAEAIKNFKGVPFRMETVAEKSGVKFINDSKSTNTASAITAIKSVKNPKVLILGGSEKGESYEKLFETVKECNVRQVVLTGKSRRNMLAVADGIGVENLTVVSDFDTAIKVSAMLAEEGDAVLLSPACASYDCFLNFAERGKRFNEIVEKLP